MTTGQTGTTAQPGAGATQLAARATAVANVFRNAASDILDRAQAQRAASPPEITGADFNAVAQRCLSLNAQALAIDNEAFVQIADEAARQFAAIEEQTKRLEASRKHINTAKEVVSVVAAVLTAAGAVVTAIVNPAQIPAAALAIGNAIVGIEQATQGHDGGSKR